MKTLQEVKSLLSQHKEELKKRYKVSEIGVFGSCARGAQKESSDIDILVEFEEVPDLLRFIEVERCLRDLLGVKVDLVRKSALRKELKEAILEEVVKT